ncbi:hypothetical protein CIPAW_13G069600 [Carya illinoinensis]|uniref:Uncharacterized protein n=1 Tax=Carya illinoinensis TaxID=32201 RepID=A0A8T1NMI9_CARIL|nr:hypothetical protein CIPAW_13G069600 [Carya illinoinensis]
MGSSYFLWTVVSAPTEKNMLSLLDIIFKVDRLVGHYRPHLRLGVMIFRPICKSR